MTQFDYVVFLVAGILGVAVDQRVAWLIVGIWALLKLLRAF